MHGTGQVQKTSSYIFLNGDSAKEKITKDQKDQFFEKIGTLDMTLQMSKTCEDRASCLSEYKAHIKNSILDFSATDVELMTETMDSALNMVTAYFPSLFIPQIELIKTDANHYGNSVYYTRENAIIIPANELKGGSINSLLPVMIHEISHIITRYNDDKKEALYNLIGFKKLDKKLKYSEAINRRILHNPDGLDNSYFIELNIQDKSYLAVPLLISSQAEPSERIKGFMNYIKFDLYEIEEKADHFFVRSKENGFSDLNPVYMTSFFDQIKENTQYIIHPDEIIADNVMMLFITERDETIGNFNEAGQALLASVKNVLAN